MQIYGCENQCIILYSLYILCINLSIGELMIYSFISNLALFCMYTRRISYAERSESSVPIHLSGVQCDGSEISILNCSSSSVVPSSVNHLQDAYVVCRPQLYDYSGATKFITKRTSCYLWLYISYISSIHLYWEGSENGLLIIILLITIRRECWKLGGPCKI